MEAVGVATGADCVGKLDLGERLVVADPKLPNALEASGRSWNLAGRPERSSGSARPVGRGARARCLVAAPPNPPLGRRTASACRLDYLDKRPLAAI